MAWRQFVMDLDALDSEAVEEVFERFGASSTTLTDAGSDPVLEPGPGETPIWAKTRITGMFSPDIDLQALQDCLMAEFELTELPPHHIEDLEDRAWEREWLKDFGPMQFGRRLWICPTGSDTPDTDAVVIHLDPGLAFGTGTHATTALCLEWLDGLSLSGKTMLDYGCGSGILAIAGLKLGYLKIAFATHKSADVHRRCAIGCSIIDRPLHRTFGVQPRVRCTGKCRRKRRHLVPNFSRTCVSHIVAHSATKVLGNLPFGLALLFCHSLAHAVNAALCIDKSSIFFQERRAGQKDMGKF